MIRWSLRILIVLVSGLAIASFALTAARHLLDRDTRDPMENSIVEGSRRITHREALYGESAAARATSPMPGIPFAVSVIALEEEPQLWHLRALAMGAVLLTALLVALVVRLESSSWLLALASAGFVLIGTGILTRFSGVARPEILVLPLVLIGLMAIRFTDGVWGALLAAVPLAAAYFVDQSAAWFLGAAYFSLALDSRGRLAAFALVAGLLVGGGYVALSHFLGPWFNFSAWNEPLNALRFRPAGALDYVTDHLLGMLQIWTLAVLLAHAMPTQPWQGKTGIWMCVGVAAVAASILSTQSTAFASDSLVPAVVLLSLLGPLIVQRIARHLSAWADPDLPAGEGVVLAALLLQFFAILTAVPTERWLPGVVKLWHSVV